MAPVSAAAAAPQVRRVGTLALSVAESTRVTERPGRKTWLVELPTDTCGSTKRADTEDEVTAALDATIWPQDIFEPVVLVCGPDGATELPLSNTDFTDDLSSESKAVVSREGEATIQ